MPDVTLEEFAAAQAEGATVLDVREPGEYIAGHVPGSLPAPLTQISSRIKDLDRSQPVYVICESGNRSAAMAAFLEGQGFTALSVREGVGGWSRSGRLLVAGTRPFPTSS